MKEYRVYTELQIVVNGELTTKPVMVFGVEAESAGGAEHKLLDNSPFVGRSPVISNALAFESSDSSEYFMTFLQSSKVYDFRDFMTRCKALAAGRTAQFQALYDEMTEAEAAVEKAAKEMQAATHRYYQALDTLNAIHDDVKAFEALYGMHNQSAQISYDSLQGIA